MIDLLLGDFLPYIIGLLALVGGVVTAYFKGKGDEKTNQRLDVLKAERETRERMDNAKPIDADADLARDRLRDRSK